MISGLMQMESAISVPEQAKYILLLGKFMKRSKKNTRNYSIFCFSYIQEVKCAIDLSLFEALAKFPQAYIGFHKSFFRLAKCETC